MEKQVIIELKDIEVEYTDFKLKKVNMKLYEGKIVGFIGKNGAGKSTTMKSMLQLIKYKKGEVFYKGSRISDSAKGEIGYIGEYNDFYEKIPVKEVTQFIKSNYKDRWNDTIYKELVLNKFGINDKKKISELSSGMKMKYLIGLTLAKQPDLLILDEPTSGLDPVVRDEVLEIISNYVKVNRKAAIISSHITEDIEKIADELVYIHDGSIVLSTHKSNIKSRFFKLHENRLNKVDDGIKKMIQKECVYSNQYYFIDTNKQQVDLTEDFESIFLSDILIMTDGGATYA